MLWSGSYLDSHQQSFTIVYGDVYLMPKEYPQRLNDTDTMNQLQDVCDCGCMEIHHKLGDYNKSKSEFDRLECRQCLCPKYKFEQKLKFKDAIDLAQRIFNEAMRKGNTQ